MSDQATDAEIAARIAEAGMRARAEAEARRAKEGKKQLPPELGTLRPRFARFGGAGHGEKGKMTA